MSKEREKLPTKILPFIWHFAKKYKFILLSIAVLGAVGDAFISVILPYNLKIIIDLVNNYKGNGNLMNIVKIPITTYILGWILMFVLWAFSEVFLYMKSISKIQVQIRNSVFQYLQGHSYTYFQNQLSGKVSNRINDIANSISLILRDSLTAIVPVFSGIILFTIVSSKVSPLFSYVIAIWSILYTILVTYLSRKVSFFSEKWSDTKSNFSGKVIDAITNILSVKSFANSKYEQKRIEKSTGDIYSKEIALFNFKLKVRIIKNSFGILFLLINFLILVHLRNKNLVNVGDFVFILQASIHQMWVIRWIGQIISSILEQIGICKQGLEIINIPHSITDKANAKNIKVNKGKIEFENVNFGYTKKKIFEGLNLTIKPNQKVGLVGFSGAGKSTLINLITRYFDINSGEILIDGQNITNVTQESLRKNISVIPQSPELFHRTILENIKYGKLNASHKDVIKASKKANCHKFIMSLPNKYDTLVGERGVKLSGGQRQRVAIARAILKEVPILILDEATSSLDSVTEKCIQNSIEKLMENKTVIAIAHRLSTLQNMDRILVFDNGKIIEDGTHNSLLRKKGRYFELWNMQTNGFIPEEKE